MLSPQFKQLSNIYMHISIAKQKSRKFVGNIEILYANVKVTQGY